jgi:hypothetical protein
MVKTTIAQTTPSVPEFTLKVVAHPYDVAPTTSIDPYTGKTIVTTNGYHVQNRSIELIIKNQPFTPYSDVNGNYIVLSYNVSSKGHYAEDWKYYPDAYWEIPLIPMKGDFTVMSFGYGDNESDLYSFLMNMPDSGQIDFRVEQRIGYYTKTQISLPIPGGPFYSVSFTGQSSDWSSIQTITIPATTPSPTPSQAQSPVPSLSPSPSIPEFPSWIILPALLVVSALAVATIKRKTM